MRSTNLTRTVDDTVLNSLVRQLIDDDFYLPQNCEEPFYVDGVKYERTDAGEEAISAALQHCPRQRLWHRFDDVI